jgi:DNA helicase-2/ATP-dependent DNA helicase PcrA
MEETMEKILEKLNLGTEGFETAAILTMTEEEANTIYRRLKKEREDVFYIDRDSSLFKKGITVTTFYMAKGLEFDQVFMMSSDEKNSYWKQFAYICATRALHELYVFKR